MTNLIRAVTKSWCISVISKQYYRKILMCFPEHLHYYQFVFE